LTVIYDDDFAFGGAGGGGDGGAGFFITISLPSSVIKTQSLPFFTKGWDAIAFILITS
jgi:hypothetical protein